MFLNSNSKEESVFDTFNYNFLGEIDENCEVGRWTVAYYYSEKNFSAWHLVVTYDTKERTGSFELDKEKILIAYSEYCKEFATIGERMLKNLPNGRLSSKKELEDEFKKQYLIYSNEQYAAKQEEKKRLKFEKAERDKRIRELKDTSYVDYVRYKYYSRYAPDKECKDYLWMDEKGDLVFEGYLWHGGECYLIGSSVRAARSCFNEIKALILKYRDEKTGYCIDIDINDDIAKSSRKISGYICKQIDINNITYEDIQAMYDEAIRISEFPLTEDKKYIAEYYAERNRQMKIDR